MIQNTLQLGEPIEHRGIVIAPLFPRVDLSEGDEDAGGAP